MSSNEADKQAEASTEASTIANSTEVSTAAVTYTATQSIDLQPMVETVFSPINTRSRMRQLGLSLLLTQEGTHRIYTTPHYAYVPTGSQIQSLPTMTTTTTTTIMSAKNSERRFVHLRVSNRTQDSEDNIVRL